ncbi:neck protein [Synechococcus phage DSL-LC02]|nr:neck protein [Synechococcus phage DSL-LC02]
MTDIYINNGGINYTSTPIIAISTSPSGGNASAIGIMSTSEGTGKLYLSNVLITNPGYGYTENPTVRFIGGGGTGIAVTVGISTFNSVGIITITSGGTRYVTNPTVTFVGNVGTGMSATANAYVTAGVVTSIILTNAGFGYTVAPTIVIGPPAGVGTGNFTPLETVTGAASSVTALVKNWDFDTKILHVSNVTGNFQIGEVIVGSASTLKYPGIGFTGSYVISAIDTSHDLDNEFIDIFSQNEEFEQAGDLIIDFQQTNPFGEYGNMGDRF